MENCQDWMEIGRVRCRVNEEVSKAVKALIALHRGILDSLMEIERSGKAKMEKLECVWKKVQRFEKNNKKFLMRMSKEVSDAPVWTCLDEEGSFRLMDMGIFLSESKYGKFSVYQSDKDKNLIFICIFEIDSFFYIASKGYQESRQ